MLRLPGQQLQQRAQQQVQAWINKIYVTAGTNLSLCHRLLPRELFQKGSNLPQVTPKQAFQKKRGVESLQVGDSTKLKADKVDKVDKANSRPPRRVSPGKNVGGGLGHTLGRAGVTA